MPKLERIASILLIISLLVPLSLQAKPKACTSINRIEFTDSINVSKALVSEYIKKKNIVGLSIAISICGKLIWSEGFGYADIENKLIVTPKTKFRIGSVSKTLTATALAQLHEAGKLDFDADIRKYLPSFPKKKYTITSRQLAGHLAGIRHYKGNEFLMKKSYPTVMEGLNIFQDEPLLHKPGSKYYYSSYGWNLLSAVIEKTSGENFLDYMSKNIFSPTKMNDTTADWNHKIIPLRTRFYSINDQGIVSNAPYVDNSYKWAGGGFIGTPEDLIKFGNAMLDHSLISQTSFELLTTPQATDSGSPTFYGIGWFTNMLERNIKYIEAGYGKPTADKIMDTLKDQNLLGHSGGSIGGKTLFWVQPKSHIAIAAVSNSNIMPDVTFNVAAEFVNHLNAQSR